MLRSSSSDGSVSSLIYLPAPVSSEIGTDAEISFFRAVFTFIMLLASLRSSIALSSVFFFRKSNARDRRACDHPREVALTDHLIAKQLPSPSSSSVSPSSASATPVLSTYVYFIARVSDKPSSAAEARLDADGIFPPPIVSADPSIVSQQTAGGAFGLVTAAIAWYVGMSTIPPYPARLRKRSRQADFRFQLFPSPAAANLLTPDTSYFVLPIGDMSKKD